MLTHERLKELLDYDLDTGIFIWKNPSSNRMHKGEQAGTINGDGYRQLSIDYKLYKTSRLAWFWITGTWPKNQIDHINGNKIDDRFFNLREATHQNNQYNKLKYQNNTSGYKRVSLDKRDGKWCAFITVNKKQINLGRRNTPEEAYKLYCEAAKKYHKTFVRF